MTVSHINTRDWYTLDSGMIVCGDCAQLMVDRTRRGKFAGYEAVTFAMLDKITDADIEAYQCDDCLVQNAVYDELGDEVD